MKQRITIRTTDELSGALEEIRKDTERPSVSEVVRDSLEFYDLIVDKIRQGKRIFIGDCRHTAGEILLPHLDRMRRKYKPSEEETE